MIHFVKLYLTAECFLLLKCSWYVLLVGTKSSFSVETKSYLTKRTISDDKMASRFFAKPSTDSVFSCVIVLFAHATINSFISPNRYPNFLLSEEKE